MLARAAAGALGLAELERVHAGRPPGCAGPEFVRWALAALRVEVAIEEEDLARIPAEGPLVVAANHPHGGIEGLALARALLERREDVRILGNALLARIEELRPLLIEVDPFGGEGAAARNAPGLRRALAWLSGGGALLAFPAGEVAHLDLRAGRVTDPPWSPHVAGLARRAGASVLPVHVPGRNGALFQAAGLVHPLLRTALLPRELLARRGRPLRVRVGAAVTPEALAGCGSDEAATRHVRWRAELLAGRDERRPPAAASRAHEPVAEPVAADALAAEMAALPPESILFETRDEVVHLLRQDEAPLALAEIGRLREVAFRAVGEGTGRARDLDRFDGSYRHLVAWSRRDREVLGSYRIGAVDELLAEGGREALYTSTLFEIEEGLLGALGPALELGRSFVRLERQRSTSGLPLLWRGLGALACREPHRPVLLGAVSISASYGKVARSLLHAFLTKVHGERDAARRVRPRRPWRHGGGYGEEVASLGSLDELSQLVALADPEGKGVPVLVRQYLKLGARVLGLNVDPAFGGVLDALIVVDLRRVDRRILEKFMGREAAAAWLACQSGG